MKAPNFGAFFYNQINIIMSYTILLLVFISVLSIIAWQNEELLGKLIFNPVIINKRKEYYRFLTNGFIHADWMHLIFNMFAFLGFGQNVENAFIYIFPAYGELLYVLFFLSAIVLSSIPDYLKHINNSNYYALGASGGVCAVIFFQIVLMPVSGIGVFILHLPAFVYGALFLYYTNYLSKRNLDNVGHSAHMMGSIIGIVVGVLIIPDSINNFVAQILTWNIAEWSWII